MWEASIASGSPSAMRRNVAAEALPLLLVDRWGMSYSRMSGTKRRIVSKITKISALLCAAAALLSLGIPFVKKRNSLVSVEITSLTEKGSPGQIALGGDGRLLA